MALFFTMIPMLFSASTFSQQNNFTVPVDGHQFEQDIVTSGTHNEFADDQDGVYNAVQNGYIRPFSELYATVEKDLYGRIIKVELEEDNNEWVYELKILFDNSVLKVQYDAATLEMLEVKGRNFSEALKPQQH